LGDLKNESYFLKKATFSTKDCMKRISQLINNKHTVGYWEV
jgi:hypothetical protein